MLEMILSPRKAKRHPWETLILGIFYGSLSVLLVKWIFSSDAVLERYSGILVVTFTVMFFMPFMYYLIRDEERKEDDNKEGVSSIKQHSRALLALLWFFLGLVIAYSFWNVVLGSNMLFDAQVRTYCLVNSPGNIESCVDDYAKLRQDSEIRLTGGFGSGERLLSIFSNNVYVLIFTLLFSLIFGAGAIFILAWNASVIAAAVGIFSGYKLTEIPIAIARYMIHGLPEIAAYFVGALAGGIISVAMIREDKEKFGKTIQDSLLLIITAIIILVIAAVIEVYITPRLF